MLIHLHSSLFWIGYAVLSLFIGTLLLRGLTKNLYENIKSSRMGIVDIDDFDDFIEISISVMCPLFGLYILWPFIILALIVWNFFKILKFVFLNSFIKIILIMDKIIPKASTKNNDDD